MPAAQEPDISQGQPCAAFFPASAPSSPSPRAPSLLKSQDLSLANALLRSVPRPAPPLLEGCPQPALRLQPTKKETSGRPPATCTCHITAAPEPDIPQGQPCPAPFTSAPSLQSQRPLFPKACTSAACSDHLNLNSQPRPVPSAEPGTDRLEVRRNYHRGDCPTQWPAAICLFVPFGESPRDITIKRAVPAPNAWTSALQTLPKPHQVDCRAWPPVKRV